MTCWVFGMVEQLMHLSQFLPALLALFTSAAARILPWLHACQRTNGAISTCTAYQDKMFDVTKPGLS